MIPRMTFKISENVNFLLNELARVPIIDVHTSSEKDYLAVGCGREGEPVFPLLAPRHPPATSTIPFKFCHNPD